jgi:hypothetical protein
MPDDKLRWEPAAKERLSKVPFFIRPFVRSRAEREAKARGLAAVTPELLRELKDAEHTGPHR